MAKDMRVIACGAGFAGDRIDPAVALARSGQVDVIAPECLAERTLVPGLRARKADPDAGADPRLERRLRPLLPLTFSKQCRVISNLGAANPAAAGRHIARLAGELGCSGMRVPLVVELAISVAGSDMTFDFTGTAPAATGPLNMAETTTRSLSLVALKHLFPDVPVNGGTFRPTNFIVPQGCILAAQYPSPVCGYTDVINRVVDVVFGALSQAIPERTPAAPFGTTGVTTVSGRRPDGSYYVAVFPYPGGYGGSDESDGLVNGTLPSSLAGFMSVEMAEHRFPLRFDYLSMRENSSGAGRHRGGCGTQYSITALDECVVSVLGDRVDHAPFGIDGGMSAQPNEVAFEIEGESWRPPMRSKAEKIALSAGDKVRLASPGGWRIRRSPGASARRSGTRFERRGNQS